MPLSQSINVPYTSKVRALQSLGFIGLLLRVIALVLSWTELNRDVGGRSDDRLLRSNLLEKA